MTIAFVLVLIAFVLACLVCWAGYAMLNSEVEVLEVRCNQNQRAASVHEQRAEDLEKERQQLADELSEAKHREQQQLQQVEAANERIEKLSAMLREATRNFEQEQCIRVKIQAEYDAYRQQVNAAIERLRGQSLNSVIGSTADYPDADFE